MRESNLILVRAFFFFLCEIRIYERREEGGGSVWFTVIFVLSRIRDQRLHLPHAVKSEMAKIEMKMTIRYFEF